MSAQISLMQIVQSCTNTYPVNGLLKYLEKVYGAIGDVKPDDNGFPKCMFLQDSLMKDFFNFYPDRICIDCSFKKFEIDLFMILFISEDSNGMNLIIAVGFLQHNDAESLKWLFEAFKKHNPNWRKIRHLAVDPSILLYPCVQHWEFLDDMFPFSFIFISSYHAIKSFKSYAFEILPDEYKISAISLFQNILYAMTFYEYNLQLQMFHALLPDEFASYFNEVWIPVMTRWRIPFDFAYEDVFKNRNDYLETLNTAIQQIFESEKNYVEFIKKVFLMISFMKREKPNDSLKPVSKLYSRFSAEYQICKILTPYAAEFVIKQLDLSQEMTIEFNPLSECYVFKYLDFDVQANSVSCQCHFYLHTLLPCRHIFCVRKTVNLCLFDGTNIDNTWNKQYHEQAAACMDDYLTNSIDKHIPHDIYSRSTLGCHLLEITTPVLLDSPGNVHAIRNTVLKNVVQVWKVGDDVSLKLIGISKSSKEDSSNILNCLESSNISNLLKNCDTFSVSKNVQIHSTSEEEKLSEINSSPSQEINTLKDNLSSEMDFDFNILNQQSLVHHEEKRASRQKRSDVNQCLLNGKHINLAYIVLIICVTKESCVNWLKAHGFLAISMKCPTCSEEMISKSLSRLNDGVTWRCMDKKCESKRSSVREGTWFEESNLTLQQMLIFTYMWLNKFGKARILLETSMSDANYVKWDKFHCRVCEESLIEYSTNMREDYSADIDELGHPSSYKDPLDKWLPNHAGKDTFLEFLKDAAYYYGKKKESSDLNTIHILSDPYSFDPKPQINQSEINQPHIHQTETNETTHE